MLKRSHYITLGLVILLALVVFNLPGRTAARLKLAFGSLFLPLFGLVGASQQAVAKASDTLVSRRELEKQNDALRRENQQLKVQSLQIAELSRENDRLRQLIGDQKTRPQWKLKFARVLMRDPANWWRTVQIDLGSRDGIRTNQPVLTTEGLVGRIHTVSFDHAQVVLVGDPKCSVAARVLNDTRDAGIVGAGGPYDTSFVDMNFLPPRANLKAGQEVVTSGDGLIFPKGIPIGRIVDWRAAEFGLYTQAQIKLNSSLAGLEEVWVMMP
jgi:rod shape-determining protein MreC